MRKLVDRRGNSSARRSKTDLPGRRNQSGL
jgi:hypothetical protein